jgi:hypothetical protein
MLSRCSLEILLDLLEIKMAAFAIQDRDDSRELERLKNCKRELSDLSQAHQQRGKISATARRSPSPAFLGSV